MEYISSVQSHIKDSYQTVKYDQEVLIASLGEQDIVALNRFSIYSMTMHRQSDP